MVVEGAAVAAAAEVVAADAAEVVAVVAAVGEAVTAVAVAQAKHIGKGAAR